MRCDDEFVFVSRAELESLRARVEHVERVNRLLGYKVNKLYFLFRQMRERLLECDGR